jgi:hypothetical protein
MSRTLISLASLAIACAVNGCGMQPAATGQATTKLRDASAEKAGGTTRFLASHTGYRVDKYVRLFLDELDSDIVLREKDQPFDPSAKTDYAINVRHAKVRQEASSLEALLNTYVFGDAKAPLKDLKVGLRGDRVTLSGKLNKGVGLPFELEGDIGVSGDGRAKLTPRSIRSLGVRVDGLMSLVGLDLANLLRARAEKGFVIEGNGVLLDPSKMLPPPKLLGPVKAIRVVNGEFEFLLGQGEARALPALPIQTPNWIALWGGMVRVNSVTAYDAKVQLVDANPADPFFFALDFYRESLEAGFVVSGRDGRLVAYLPDANAFTPALGRFAPALPFTAIRQPESDMQPVASDENE